MVLRRLSAVVACSATVLCLATVAAAHAGTSTVRPATASSPAVTLLTGERVALGSLPGGRPSVQVIRTNRPNAASAVSINEMSGDVYVLPAIVRPYLGRFIDPSLFDVSALSRESAAARTTVTLTYRGTAAPSVPGITITRASGGTATGHLTPGSVAFGTALMNQYSADAKAGWPVRSTLFGAVTGIAASAVPVARAVPAFPMQTLIIKVLDSKGRPVPFGVVAIMNVENASKLEAFIEVVDGQARVSVPVGRYAGLVDVDSFDPNTFLGSSRLFGFDNYRVNTDRQVLTLDARTATSRLSVSTPQRAGLVSLTWEWDRFAAGQSGGIEAGFGVGPGIDLFTAPLAAPPASIGTLNSLTTWSLTGAGTTGQPYTYDLAFAANGIPAVQHHTVATSDLQTVDATYASDHGPDIGGYLRAPILPFQFLSGGDFSPMTEPLARTEFVLDTPTAVWFSVLLPELNAADPFASMWQDGPRLAPAGTTARADWISGPLVPSVPVVTDGTPPGAAFCSVCRTDDAMEMFFAPVTDTTPGHYSYPAVVPHKAVARFKVFIDGSLIFDQTNSGGGSFPVPSGGAEYRIVDDVDRQFGGAVQSRTTQTVLTFRSAAGQGGRLPAGWICDMALNCTIPPILQAGVALPVDLLGQVPIGNSQITVSLSHIQGAPRPDISSAGCAVQFAGTGWQHLPVTALGGGRYACALHTTRAQAGEPVDLRITGTDVGGATINQTTTAAFVVAGS